MAAIFGLNVSQSARNFSVLWLKALKCSMHFPFDNSITASIAQAYSNVNPIVPLSSLSLFLYPSVVRRPARRRRVKEGLERFNYFIFPLPGAQLAVSCFFLRFFNLRALIPNSPASTINKLAAVQAATSGPPTVPINPTTSPSRAPIKPATTGEWQSKIIFIFSFNNSYSLYAISVPIPKIIGSKTYLSTLTPLFQRGAGEI
jgi:hypothetical protein